MWHVRQETTTEEEITVTVTTIAEMTEDQEINLDLL